MSEEEQERSFGVRFGKLVRNKRGLAGLTQEQLAARAYGDPSLKSRISEIETGRVKRPHQRTIDTLAIALSISQEELSRVSSEARSQSISEVALIDQTILENEISANLAQAIQELSDLSKSIIEINSQINNLNKELSNIDDKSHSERASILHNNLGKYKLTAARIKNDKKLYREAIRCFEEAARLSRHVY